MFTVVPSLTNTRPERPGPTLHALPAAAPPLPSPSGSIPRSHMRAQGRETHGMGTHGIFFRESRRGKIISRASSVLRRIYRLHRQHAHGEEPAPPAPFSWEPEPLVNGVAGSIFKQVPEDCLRRPRLRARRSPVLSFAHTSRLSSSGGHLLLPAWYGYPHTSALTASIWPHRDFGRRPSCPLLRGPAAWSVLPTWASAARYSEHSRHSTLRHYMHHHCWNDHRHVVAEEAVILSVPAIPLPAAPEGEARRIFTWDPGIKPQILRRLLFLRMTETAPVDTRQRSFCSS